MLLSCEERKGMSASQERSCATSHIYIEIGENKNVLHTWSKTQLLLHIQHPQNDQWGFLRKSFI